MTTVEYDLDTSGGLMDKIQALIAPPESEDSNKTKKKKGLDLHPYFKRPGKGHNRDCCDSCGEGGNLICCDKCPASFHLTCHDPPLEDADIPLGQWLCHSCRIAAGLPSLRQLRAEKMKEDSAMDCSPTQTKEDSTSEPVTRGRTRLASTTSNDSNKSRVKSKSQAQAPASVAAQAQVDKGSSATPAASIASNTKPSPMDLLVAAASSMNPRQFELPREMLVPIVFPGTDKVGPVKQGNRRGPPAKKKQPYELDNNGLVPLPAKLCYECKRSCRKAPLVSCDYCPLYFHQDCLDPPLTAMPTGRWMCPNHHQQVLEEKLLSSVSVTERVRLWDSYSGPVDPDVVKSEFFRKVRRRHPPFRFKVRLGPRARVRVPNAVREHYRVRPSLTPSLRDVLRQDDQLSDVRTEESTEEDQEVWLSSVVALQTSIACHLAKKRKRKDEAVICVKEETISDDGEDSQPTQTSKVKQSCNQVDEKPSCKLMNGDVDTTDKAPIGNFASRVEGKLNVKSSISTEPSSTTKDDVDPFIDSCLLEKLTGQLESSIEDAVSVDTLNKVDSRLVRLLALQRLQQLTSRKLEEPRSSPSSPPAVCAAGLRPRAVLTPLLGSQTPLPIFYRVVEIGSSVNMDVCLSQYGHCNFITSKHAVIICDEVNKHYELMNYSEHGTTVDNVLYSCDFSEKTSVSSGNGNAESRQRRSSSVSPSQSPNSVPEQEIPPLIQRVREVVRKQREQKAPEEEGTMPSSIGKTAVRCGCRRSGSSLIGGSGAGWEGTAILNHGSVVKFGCIQFTFSITSCAPTLPPATNHYAPLTGRFSDREPKESDSSSSVSVSESSSATKHADVDAKSADLPIADVKSEEADDRLSAETSNRRSSGEDCEEIAERCDDTDMEEVSLPLYTHPKLVAAGNK